MAQIRAAVGRSKMDNNINRIVILEKNVKGDLSRCNICNINFTAMQPCIICAAIIDKEEELGRKLTQEEFRDLTRGLFGEDK